MKKLMLTILAFAAIVGSVEAQPKRITLDDIWSRATFRPNGISSIRSMQDGEHYCVLTRSGIEKYSYKTGEKVGVVCAFKDPMRKTVKPIPPIESYEFSQDEPFDYDMLVFFSPSGIQSLLKNFPNFEQGDIAIGTFGPTTAKAVQDAGLRLDLAAPSPEYPSMTMALSAYIKKVNGE